MSSEVWICIEKFRSFFSLIFNTNTVLGCMSASNLFPNLHVHDHPTRLPHLVASSRCAGLSSFSISLWFAQQSSTTKAHTYTSKNSACDFNSFQNCNRYFHLSASTIPSYQISRMETQLYPLTRTQLSQSSLMKRNLSRMQKPYSKLKEAHISTNSITRPNERLACISVDTQISYFLHGARALHSLSDSRDSALRRRSRV